MNRHTHRSTAFVFAAVMTIGMLKGIALLAVAPAFEEAGVEIPAVEVTASATPLQAQIDFNAH